VSLLGLAGCAPIEGEVADPEAILAGAASSEASVVAIATVPPACGAPVGVVCTGTVVSSRLVLTAAHCFEGVSPGVAFAVIVGDDATAPTAERHRIASVTTHPDYDPATNVADLAALVVDPPLTVAPMPIGRAPLDASVVGASVQAYGFGATSSTTGPSGTRAVGTMVVTSLEGTDQLRLGPMPSMSCRGDSGGAVAIGGALVAVTAAGDPGCTTYGVAVRLDAHLTDFVDPALASAAGWVAGPSRIAPDAVCTTACMADTDCPSGLSCVPTASGSRCALGGMGVGQLGAACAGPMGCTGMATCAQTASDGCRCFVPCASGPPMPPGGSSGGCSVVAAHPARAMLGVLIFCAALLKNRTRARSRFERDRRPLRAEVPTK
jgi:hypothetical protein